MDRLRVTFAVFGLAAVFGAAGAPLADYLRGGCILLFVAAAFASVAGAGRLASELFGASLVLLVASTGVAWLTMGLHSALGDWRVLVAASSAGCLALAIGAGVLCFRAFLVSPPALPAPRPRPTQTRTPFIETVASPPPWLDDAPPRRPRDRRPADETGLFGGGRRR